MHGAIVPVLIAIAAVTALTGIADSHAQVFYTTIPVVKANETSAELSFINRWADDLVEVRLVDIYNPDTIVDSLGPIGKDVRGTLTISDPQPATFYLMEVRLENGSWGGRDSRAWIYHYPDNYVSSHNLDVKIIKDPHNTGRADQIAVQFSNSRVGTYYDVNSPSGRGLQDPRGDIYLQDGQVQNQSTITLTEEGAHTITIYAPFVTIPIPDYILEYVHPNDEPTGAHIISPSADGPLAYKAPAVNVAPTIDQSTLGTGVDYVDFVIGAAKNITLSIDDTETLEPGDITADNPRVEILAGDEPNVFVLRFVPDESDRGRTSIKITVTDAGGQSNTATLFADAGDGSGTTPSARAPDIDVEAVPGMLTSVNPDIGANSTITGATGATKGSITGGFLSLGTIAYTANANVSGIDEVTYAVSDGAGSTAQGTVYFYINEPGNDRPVIAEIPGMQTEEETVTFQAVSVDIDDEALTYAIRNAPAGAMINSTTGAFSWNTTGFEAGDYIFNVVVHDDAGGLAVQKMAITVSDPNNGSPTAPVVHRSTTPGASILVAPDIRDPEGQPTSMILAVGAYKGTIREEFLEANTIAYVPETTGVDVLFYTTSDGRGGATTSMVYIHTGTSADPEIDAIGVQRVEVSETLEFQPSAADDPNDGIAYTMDGAPDGATLDLLGEKFSWTPEASDIGDHVFTLIAYDGQGGFDTEPVAISVSAPGTANEDPNISDFDSAARQNNPRFIALQTSDPDGDPTGIILATGATTGSILQDSLRFGIIAYVPGIDEVGTDTVTYVISDGRGGASTGTIHVHIRDPANDEPVMESIGIKQVDASNTLTFDVTATDNEGDELTFGIRNAPDGATMTSDGAFSWTPDTSDVGDHTFTVTVYDDGGGFATEDIIVTVTDPTSANQNPTASDESTTTAGERVPILPDIDDPDGDDLTIIAAEGAIQGLIDSEPLRDAIIAYTPFAGATGVDTITYTVSDGRGGLATGVITIDVSEPVGQTDEVQIGLVLPFTGGTPSRAQENAEGSRLAVSDFNEHLKAMGADWSIVMVEEDTANNPAVALEKIQSLDAKGIKLVVGPGTSANVRSVKDYSDSNNMLLISCCSTAPSLAIADDSVYRMVPDDSFQGVALSNLMSSDQIEVIVPVWRGDTWGDGLHEKTGQTFAADGQRIFDEGIRYAPEAVDFAVEVSILAQKVQQHVDEHGPDRVGVMFAGFGEVARLMQAASEHDILDEVKWYGSDANAKDHRIVEDRIALEFADAVRFTALQAATPDNPTYQRVTQHVEERLGRLSSTYVHASYDAVWLLGLSMLETGGADPDDIKRVLFDVAADYTGAIGDVMFNNAGDLVPSDYEIWNIQGDEWRQLGKTSAFTMLNHTMHGDVLTAHASSAPG